MITPFILKMAMWPLAMRASRPAPGTSSISSSINDPMRGKWIHYFIRSAGGILLAGALIRFLTAGESHGEALIALVSGVPAGVLIGGVSGVGDRWNVREQGVFGVGRCCVGCSPQIPGPHC